MLINIGEKNIYIVTLFPVTFIFVTLFPVTFHPTKFVTLFPVTFCPTIG